MRTVKKSQETINTKFKTRASSAGGGHKACKDTEYVLFLTLAVGPMGVSSIAAFYTLHICNNYSSYEFNINLKKRFLFQSNKCLLDTGSHGAVGNVKLKGTSALTPFLGSNRKHERRKGPRKHVVP